MERSNRHLEATNLDSEDFSQADLTEAFLRSVYLVNATFFGADLSKT
jgi:uncharacterized protein YjbI with pentapeptide repeats